METSKISTVPKTTRIKVKLIKYFAVENFRSIKEENALEFDRHLPDQPNFVAHPVIGFAGANASGKTTILQAITFALWFMQDSFFKIEKDAPIPIAPFCTNSDHPTKFHIIFSQEMPSAGEERRVDFEYELSLNEHEVIYETLHYYPLGRKRIAYIRDGREIKIGSSLSRPANDLRSFARDLRRNSSIISYAAQFPSQELAIACKNYQVWSNVTYSGLRELEFNPGILEDLLHDEETYSRTREFLKIADVGIEDIHYEQLHGEPLEQAIRELKEMGEEQRRALPPRLIENLDRVLERQELAIINLWFRHSIDSVLVDFDPDQESSGTQKFLTILHLVIQALQEGSILILDEIELKLHQNLVAYLIGLFENARENLKGAQLLFSFHNTSLMKLLLPEQLWFTEKNDKGQTEVFSASDFEDIKEIHEKDLEKLYRIGRFGAKPRGI
ncbi:MAG: AAA family ATPase [Chloroflexota bacterium]